MVLRVNGEMIPEQAIEYEFDRLVKLYSEFMPVEKIKEQMDMLRRKAGDQAIGAKLLIHEAVKLDADVPVAEIDARLEAMIDNAGGQLGFEGILQKQGLTVDVVRQSIRQGLQVDKLIEKVTGCVDDPTEDEMQAHFENHEDEYAKSERAQAQHVLVRSDSDSLEDRETARSRIMEIRRKIEEGADFADMAAAHSDCPSGKKAGGSLGWFSRGMMIPEFDKAVFSMEVGHLSEVVETPFGYHLIRKTGHEPGGKVPFVEASDKVREFLRHARRGQVIAEYVEDLKQKAVIQDDGRTR
jgi:peptidyl-prolyl cis-trans isomerase C